MGKSTKFGPEMTELKHAAAAVRPVAPTVRAGARAAAANPCEATITKFSARAAPRHTVIFSSIFRDSYAAACEMDGRTPVRVWYRWRRGGSGGQQSSALAISVSQSVPLAACPSVHPLAHALGHGANDDLGTERALPPPHHNHKLISSHRRHGPTDREGEGMTRVPHRAALLALVSGAIRGRRKVRASPPPKLVDGRQWRSRPRLRVLALVYLVVEEISSQGRGRQREKEIGLFPRQPGMPFVRPYGRN